jgi:hypothetical protein
LVGLITLLSSGILILFFSSIILWYLECKKYDNKIENRLCGEGMSVKDEDKGCIEKDTSEPEPETKPETKPEPEPELEPETVEK